MHIKHRKIIAVDIDGTVVDSISPWITWYEKLTGHDIVEEVQNSVWNLDKLMHFHDSPMDYWKQPNLYDDLEPTPESKKALDGLSKDYDIIFVSSCFPEHTKSKEFFVKRNFPYHKAFINAHFKGYTRCDYFIDDYKKNLEQFPDYVKTFHIQSVINTNITDTTWVDILNEIKGEE